MGRKPRALGPLHALLAASLLLNAWLLLRPSDSSEPASSESPSEGGDPAVEVVASALPVDGEAAPPEAASSEEAPEEPTPAGELPASFTRVEIDGPVSRAFVAEVGSPEGDRLALTANRILVWNLDLTKDPRPGDVVEALYRVPEDQPVEIEILALRYQSAKFGRSFEAYRFQPEGWVFPGWFDSDGREVAAFLEQGPIRDYEQITSLLGDGRGHSGMDFKAPVGTEVLAPFAGVVTRTTWRFKYNGNSVEIRGADGRTARFLHLSELASGLKSGSKVTVGQVLGLSGNTGRSFAPHLHYELSTASGRTLDPLDEHTTRHRVLAAADKANFEILRDRSIERLDAGSAERLARE